MASRERWTEVGAPRDFVGAADYLSLLVGEARAQGMARRLRAAPVTRAKAKDLLRASRLDLLPIDDPEVVKDLKKIKKGRRLAPVLLVRGQLDGDVPLTIADGYHRVCASYHLDEDADIPCLVVDLPAR